MFHDSCTLLTVHTAITVLVLDIFLMRWPNMDIPKQDAKILFFVLLFESLAIRSLHTLLSMTNAPMSFVSGYCALSNQRSNVGYAKAPSEI